jgi:Uma2 family endonuclease
MPSLAATPSASDLRLWTAEEFLDWLEPGVKAGLIDGDKHMHSPVDLKHARLVNFLDRLLGAYVESRKLGEVHREMVAVRLSARNVFLPDIAYFTNEQVAKLLPTFVPFAPTFVVEVLSPGNPERDLVEKFPKYEEHGVKEYWILDPEHLRHRFFRRENELLVEFAQCGEQIQSQSVKGFWVKRTWLNPEKLPEVSRCLREVMGKL